MSFKLRILIDGLCAFLPNKRCAKMKVLLLNSLTPSAAAMGMGTGSGAEAVPYHYPTLRIPINHFDRHHSTAYRYDFRTDDTLSFFVAWEDICIEAIVPELQIPENPPCDPTLPPFRIQDGRRPCSAEPATPKEEHDFSWVVDVTKLVPDAAVEPSLLGCNPARNLLMGRLHLDYGVIATAEVAKYGGRNVIFEFGYSQHSQPIAFTQAMAARVLYTLEVPDCCLGVDLHLVRFGDYGVASRRRTIRIKHNGAKQVTLQLRNVPLEDLLGLPPIDPTDLGLGHYGVLYRCLSALPSDPPIPRPLFEPFTSRGLATGATTICTGHTLPETDYP